MGGSFKAALDALSRPEQSPLGFCAPFLDVFPVTGAAVSTLGDLLGSETLSASDRQAARLDELQFDLGEGPCWDALNHARPVLEPNLRREPNSVWPAFTAAILDDDISSIFAFPLLVGPLRIGAIDLYSVEPVNLSETQSRQAGTMAGIVGRHVLRQALAAISRDVEETDNAYSRRLIHQATGIVLAQLNMSPEDARLVIQGHAFAATRTMMQTSQDIIDGKVKFSRNGTGIEASQ